MYRIMIVDDETVMLNTLKKYIQERLPDCQLIGQYRTAMEALESFKKEPADIVLIDIRMPEMDGLEFIRQLNLLNIHYIPIIISSYGEFSYAKTAMSLGVIHYLLKPIDFNELHQALLSAIQKVEQHRINFSPADHQQNEQELYLVELFSGFLNDVEQSSDRFRNLNFPFSYENTSGIILHINYKSTKNWNYEQDSLHTAIGNLLNMLFSPLYYLTLFCEKDYCDILLFHPNCQIWNFQELCAQAQQLLGITITANKILYFCSLKNFNTHNYHSILSKTPNLNISANSSSALIANAIDYIQKHYMEDLTRETIASKVYLSGAHFSRLFKQETGTTYQNYLLELRMKKSIELLQTNLKISDIAKKVGYTSLNRFIINFRHYTSYSPSEYRRNVLKIF